MENNFGGGDNRGGFDSNGFNGNRFDNSEVNSNRFDSNEINNDGFEGSEVNGNRFDNNEINNDGFDGSEVNGNHPHGNGSASEGNKKPWFLTPSVTVEKGYNPYRDGESVFGETVKKYKGVFKGAGQLENETPLDYYYRHGYEWSFARNEAKKSLGRSSRFIAAILILYLFLTNFFVLCFQGVLSEGALETVVTLLQYLVIAPALIILANIGCKHKTYTFFRKPQTSGFYIFKWCVIALGLTYAVSIVSNIFFTYVQMLGVNVNDLSQPIPDTPGSLVLYFLTVVVGAPLFEEILFRGVFLTHHLKYGCWHAIIVTGILFGLIHQNHQQMFFAAALGILFGYIDVKAGSIIPSVIAHITVNLYSFIITFFMYFTNYNETLADPSIAFDGPAAVLMISGILNMLAYALAVASVVMLIYEKRKNSSEFILPKGDSFLTEGEKLSAFFKHPVMIVLLVLLAISIYMISFFNFGIFDIAI